MNKSKELESCVYYFFIETENNKKKQKIHKIFENDFFIQNELTNQQKLLKIDTSKYFYLCENVSQLKLAQIDDYIRHLNAASDNTILLCFDDRQLIYLKDYLKTLSSPKKYILTIINFYKHLLTSLHLLSTSNIFHNHINFDSIVVDNNHYPLLTNFSFSIDISHTNIDNHIKQYIIAYDPSYIEWPIELHILSFLLTNKLNSLSSYNIEFIINEHIKHNNILNTFGENVVSSYKLESLQYFQKYVNQSYQFILNDILRFSHTWDNYALSLLFLRILIGIHRTIQIKNKFIILFMKLLVSNIHLNPFKRGTIEMTTQSFNILLDSLEPKDYTDVINKLNN